MSLEASDQGWLLCVDDDGKVLSGLELQLGLDYELATAPGGEEGLAILAERPDCAVIISDMRMPGMNGAQFLAKAREVSPDSTRMLLTGYSEIDAAISAINDGGIFRFLTKPTPPEDLKRAVDDGIRQWQLVRSEKILLEQTVRGAAQSLIEALEIASPGAFSRARRLEDICRHVAGEVGLNPTWPVALAGLFLRLGWIAIPTEVVEARMTKGLPEGAYAQMFAEGLATSVRLVGRIPRMEEVAEIIGATAMPSGRIDGGNILAAVAEFDDLCVLGRSPAEAMRELRARDLPREILNGIATWSEVAEELTIKEIKLSGAIEGMIVEDHIMSAGGQLLVRAGSELTRTLIDRLRNYASSQGVKEPITVSIHRHLQ